MKYLLLLGVLFLGCESSEDRYERIFTASPSMVTACKNTCAKLGLEFDGVKISARDDSCECKAK